MALSKVQVNVRISKKLYHEMRRAAKARRLSANEAITRAIEAYIAPPPDNPAVEPHRQEQVA